MVKIQILVFNGADELDFIGPYEVLKMAAQQVPTWEISLVTSIGLSMIVAAHGARIQVEGTLGIPQPDVLIIPGGGWLDRSPEGAWKQAKNQSLLEQFSQLHRKGVLLTSVCTGAMLLAEAGLLKGRRAVTHHEALAELKKAGATVEEARVVDDGDIVTAGGVTSGIDLALYLVERLAGKSIQQSIAKALEYPSGSAR